MRWNHLFSKNLFFNLTTIGSNFYLENYDKRIFKNNQSGKKYTDDFVYSSGITDVGFKTDFDYYGFKYHQIKFGNLLLNHRFNPGITAIIVEDVFNNGSSSATLGSVKDDLFESALYFEDNIKFSVF